MNQGKIILAVVVWPERAKLKPRIFAKKNRLAQGLFWRCNFDEMKLRGIPVNEANERKMREELRPLLEWGRMP